MGVVSCRETKKWRLDKAADLEQRTVLDAQWKWMARIWQLVNTGFPKMTVEAACAAVDAKFCAWKEANAEQKQLGYKKWVQSAGEVPVLSGWAASRRSWRVPARRRPSSRTSKVIGFASTYARHRLKSLQAECGEGLAAAFVYFWTALLCALFFPISLNIKGVLRVLRQLEGK